jgi:Uroporphyrinogen decarboxylase (URO-D)
MSVTLDALVAKAGHTLFLPIGFRFLLKLEQVEWDEFCRDPALATFTLRAAQRLFNADGLINWFDDWLEAEGAGASVKRSALGVPAGKAAPLRDLPDPQTFATSAAVARAIEIAGRLGKETGGETVALAYLTGPRTLFERLFGAAAARRMAKALKQGKPRGADMEALEAAAELSLTLAKAYCEAGCGALVLAEDENPGDLECLSAFSALLNLAEYYNVPILLLSRHPLGQAARAAARAAGLQFIASPAGGEGLQTIPLEILMENADHAVAWAKALPAAYRLVVTEWEIPPAAIPEAVIALRNEINRGP